MPDRADLAQLTVELVNIPSVTGDEHALAAFVAARLKEAGRTVERFEGCVVSPGASGTTLVGHLDTVPPEGNAGARIEDGRVWGRGSTDMKGGLAVMLALADTEAGLVFYPREEGPLAGNGLTPLIAAGGFPETRLAVVLEPTDMTVQLGCLGVVNAEAVFAGQAAHSARPWLGRNAIHMAAGLLAELGGRQPNDVEIRPGLVYREVMSATTASGGSARNVVPAEFRVNVNFRFAPGRGVHEAVAEVAAVIEGHGARCVVVDGADAGPLCEDNPVLDKLLGLGLPVAPKQAWTDVAQLGAAGIDAVNLGPGETALAHTAAESVAIDALKRCYDALSAILR